MKILPTATMLARWGAYLGLVCGVLYSFGGVVVDLFTIGLNWGTVMAFGALVGMPAIFALFGFFLGGLISLIAQAVGAARDRMETRSDEPISRGTSRIARRSPPGG